MAKAPYYRERGVLPTASLFEKLKIAASALDGKAPQDLMNDLWRAIEDAEEDCRADKTITKGPSIVGYGVSKEQKAIACDNIMTIVKQIKASKAW